MSLPLEWTDEMLHLHSHVVHNGVDDLHLQPQVVPRQVVDIASCQQQQWVRMRGSQKAMILYFEMKLAAHLKLRPSRVRASGIGEPTDDAGLAGSKPALHSHLQSSPSHSPWIIKNCQSLGGIISHRRQGLVTINILESTDSFIVSTGLNYEGN